VIVAYIDGGSRGNPGPAGFGVRIERGNGTLVEEIAESIGIATNNVAEYRGLLAALEWARRQGERELLVRSDSQLLVEQMRGVYKVRNPGLQPLHARARLLANEIGRVSFEHVPRERNARADRLANLAMDGKSVVASTSREADEPGPINALEPSPDSSNRDAGALDDPLTPTERSVRVFIYRHLIETMRAPDVATIAAAVGTDQPSAAAALHDLAAAHALVMAPSTTNIWMAHPFSAVPTMFPVVHEGRTYWANCAWDAAGVMSLVGGGTTETRCADCAEPLTIAIRDGNVIGDAVVHFAVAPRRFWDNIAFT
jgi:ribonuclease HI